MRTILMSGTLLAALVVLKPTAAFVSNTFSASSSRLSRHLYSSVVTVESGVSRIATLQTLLAQYGAPGSKGCAKANDLVAVVDEERNLKLHPHLFAIAKSASTGNFICALRRCYADDSEYESSTKSPWPIVETAEGARGMKLLALNSEHLMRRMAAASDVAGNDGEIISLYNEGLGQGKMSEAALDAPYQAGSVEQLGYGHDKYILLRVGPFPDLYESMALSHKERGDESSSLIAAEASNGKFIGFGSTFAFYARLLSTFDAREDEARDAARMCLRVPLPSLGFSDEDFQEVAVLGKIADPTDSMEEALAKLQIFFEKMKTKETEEDPPGMGTSKTEEQMAIDKANTLLDRTALGDANWMKVRSELADIYASAGKDDMAIFVDPSRV